MPVYIALLRGINIGPHKRMKMNALVACCGACGFPGAKTYIQSGNVVLKAKRMPPEQLARQLEEQMTADFGFSADVIIRSRDELSKTITNNSLLQERGMDPEKLHVAFLRERPEAGAITKLKSLTLAPDHLEVVEKDIYFYFPHGVSKSSLWKHPLDKVLGVSATMRNWNTVNKLYEMAQECE